MYDDCRHRCFYQGDTQTTLVPGLIPNIIHLISEYRSGDVADLVDMAVPALRGLVIRRRASTRRGRPLSVWCFLMPPTTATTCTGSAAGIPDHRPGVWNGNWGAGAATTWASSRQRMEQGRKRCFRDGLHGGVRDAAALRRSRTWTGG